VKKSTAEKRNFAERLPIVAGGFQFLRVLVDVSGVPDRRHQFAVQLWRMRLGFT
jgi:hypothetical protein